MESETINLILAGIGVLGTWIGIYFTYRGLKKDTSKVIESLNKFNIQKGDKNINFQ